ncbi:hypothetical protein EJ08DRAFT_649886 [Tothia fuscella]|uniref:Zn(2)-C6 fungal-type domain-containing protein n=1 Tax=Tothia fuscella TaxID=1048955 RepID=A0A9P4TYP4_9PEZI|nr:hypothetical protein EJ08DRAFT_649886 [Tothia fuscella]
MESNDLPRNNFSSAGTHSSKSEVGKAFIQVACLPCRSRHLKCDGGVRCSRCVTENNICSYVKSRRGWKGSRKRLSTQQSVPASLSEVVSSHDIVRSFEMLPTYDPLDLQIPPANNTLTAAPTASPYDSSFPGGVNIFGQRPLPTAGLVLKLDLPSVDDSKPGLINTYYTHFHPAHPFLLPQSQMLQLLNTTSLPHIELALQYMGSFYIPAASTQSYQQLLLQSISDMSLNRDAHMVQAMLIYAIGLHIADEEEASTTAMGNTITLALELGMHRRNFAQEAGSQDIYVEEAWRRTWWEIFVLDGMFAGTNPTYKLQLFDMKLEVYLPSEDIDLLTGLPTIPKTLDDYDDALFLNDTPIFPTSTYRIDAIRLLQKVFAASRASPTESYIVEAADVHLTNWTLHLPPTMRAPMDRDGNVDEILFQAHMIVSACAIMLHRPRSDLSTEDVKEVTTCVGAGQTSPTASLHTDIHTAKAMQAAKDISFLITLPCPLIKHTPFFTCAVTMASIVFLSYWSFIATESGDAFIKENIRLNIGVLKTLGEIWPIAGTVLKQVRGVAKELFQSRKAMNNAYWMNVTREEVLRGMLEGSNEQEEVFDQFFLLPAS